MIVLRPLSLSVAGAMLFVLAIAPASALPSNSATTRARPPARAVLVSQTSIDGARIGELPVGFWTRIKADYNERSSQTGEQFLLWGATDADQQRTLWASMTRFMDGSVESMSYFGPLRTAAGDRTGSSLVSFRRHWRRAKTFKSVALAGNGTGWNAVITSSYHAKEVADPSRLDPQPTKVIAIFGFDSRARLRGVEIQVYNPKLLGVETECSIPACAP